MSENSLFVPNQLVIKIPSPEKILIIYNPISSAGNTKVTANYLEAALATEGKPLKFILQKEK